ncbi:MAG: hypothetical protein AAGF59_01265 [Pseudomonadota bacterium]
MTPSVRSTSFIRLRRLVLTAGLVLGLLAPGAASAQVTGRVDASRVTCSELQGIVKELGAAIVYSDQPVAPFNLGLAIFGQPGAAREARFGDRFVANRRYCQFNERLISLPVSTLDNRYCYLKHCQDRSFRDDDF